jgi:molecular chaperone GrpE
MVKNSSKKATHRKQENTGTKPNNKEEMPEESIENTQFSDEEDYGSNEQKAISIETLLGESLNKLADLQDRYMRLSAEFDNYRKRTLKEKSDLIQSAGSDFLLKILPVMDNFERALKILDEASDMDAVKEGIHLIYNNFKDFLNQQGLREIEALNKDFDLDVHEAVGKTPASDENMKGKIVDVVQKGYSLKDKVIRYSKVIIGE